MAGVSWEDMQVVPCELPGSSWQRRGIWLSSACPWRHPQGPGSPMLHGRPWELGCLLA